MFRHLLDLLTSDGFNPATTFTAVEETEIPALQEHCHNTAGAARDAHLRRFADKSLFFLDTLNFQLQEFESDRIQKKILSEKWETHYSTFDITVSNLLSSAVESIREDVERLIVRKLRRSLAHSF